MVIESSINQKISVMDIDHESSWMDLIIEFINNGNLPCDLRTTRSIRFRAPRYCIIEGVLFCRNITLPCLRFPRPSESLKDGKKARGLGP